MSIPDIIAAFGEDKLLDFDSIKSRLSIEDTAAGFARKLKKFNIRARRARLNGKIVRAYDRSHFEQVAQTKKAYWQYEITL